MTPRLVFLHGWGCDAAIFDPLRAALSDVPSVAEDLGFFGPARPAEATGIGASRSWDIKTTSTSSSPS